MVPKLPMVSSSATSTYGASFVQEWGLFSDSHSVVSSTRLRLTLSQGEAGETGQGQATKTSEEVDEENSDGLDVDDFL